MEREAILQETLMAIRCLIFIFLLGPALPSVAAPDQYWIKFDEYSNISWKQETKRLDTFITQLRHTEQAQAYLIAYGGRRSCPDEARLRAERVKNYILRSGVLSVERITIIDAGYREQWSIALKIGVVGGPQLTKKFVQEVEVEPSISESQVKILKRCEKSLSQSHSTFKWQLSETMAKIRNGETSTSRTEAAEHLAMLTRGINPHEVDDTTLTEMLSLLETQEDSVRAWVAAALGHLGPRAKVAVPKLLKLLPEVDCLRGSLTSAPFLRVALKRMGEIPPPPPNCEAKASTIRK